LGQAKRTNGKIRGQCSRVTLPEFENSGAGKSIGRFGWKAQHASLLSASAEALDSELGESNQFFRTSTLPPVAGAVAQREFDSPRKELDSIVQFLRSTDLAVLSAMYQR
jgi:CxxC motif-containing protein (DUF1111 family)